MASAVKTGDGDRLANFKYAAPEQRNGQPASEKSDVYSAGAVINEIFTGICPHGVGYKTIGSVAPDFDYLDEIVGRMLRSSPEDRPTISDVKALIAVRQRDFPLRQKVRSDDSKIVYESEVEDPIVREPLRIIDADFRDGKILFVLSQPTNNIWRDMFANLSGVEYTPTMHPRYLQIVDREIIIPNGIGLPPSAIRDYVSKYIDSVNLQYRDLVLRQAQMRIDAERKRREDEVKDQERRQAIRRQLGFGPNEEGTA